MQYNQKTNINDLFELEKEIKDETKQNLIFKQIVGYIGGRRVINALINVKKGNMQDNDCETRDILLYQTFKDELQYPNMFQYSVKHLNEKRSMSSSMKYHNILRECKKKKHLFVFKSYHSFAEDEDIVQSQTILQNSIRKYLLPSQIIGIGVALLLRRVFKLYNNPIGLTGFCVVSCLTGSTFFAYYKFSERIFQDLTPLPSIKLEKQRQDIINYCMPIDIEMVAFSFEKFQQQ